jgi:hypothetical protein
VYGVLFALVWWLALRRLRLPVVAVGVAFGALLWLLATLLVLPLSGSALQSVAPLWFAMAHLAYGLALGGVLRKLWTTIH